MKLGKASYGAKKKTYFKIKDGDNTYRILPPMGDLADDGVWSMFYNVHYGYKNSEGKLRPFVSPLVKNYKTKMIEVPDAALERIEKLKAQLELAKKNGDAKMVAKLNEFVGPKGSFNLDKNHYVNAIDTQGNIGILKLRHRAMQALKDTMAKLRENGCDPLSIEDGRFFVIRRSGNGLDTTFQVTVLAQPMEIAGVGKVMKEVVHVIDDSIIKRLSSEAAALDKIFKSPTSEQVARIVAEGPAAVDEILDAKTSSAGSGGATGGGEDFDDSGDYEDETSSAQSASAAAMASGLLDKATVPSTTTASTAGLTQTQASAPIIQTQTVASTLAPAATVASTTTTAAQVEGQSDADFLKSIGL